MQHPEAEPAVTEDLVPEVADSVVAEDLVALAVVVSVEAEQEGAGKCTSTALSIKVFECCLNDVKNRFHYSVKD